LKVAEPNHAFGAGNTFFTSASDVSADGSVIVGGLTGVPAPAPFRWTAASGIQLLMDGADLLTPGSASAVSADGTVIVGARVQPNVEAFRWTAPEQVIGLGDLPGGEYRSDATDVSADGSVVVGNSDAGNGLPGLGYQLDAFFWTEETGMVSLREFLSAYGVTDHLNLSLQAYAVSASGRTIVGAAYDATGLPRAFIATIPEPSTLALATLAALGGFIVLLVRRPLDPVSGP
jgi:uncharacterized membrane protein